MVLVFFLDNNVFDIPIINEIKPEFSPFYLLRSVLIIISSACLVIAITTVKHNPSKQKARLNAMWQTWGKLNLSNNTQLISISRAKLLVFSLSISSSFFVLLFLHSPYTYSILSYEDSLIENSSALLTLLSGVIFLYLARYIQQSRQEHKILLLTISLIFCAIFFLITLEEISWFQRILDLSLPQRFEENLQLEMNLHNFATDESELFYYTGSFLFLIFIPFVYAQHQDFPLNSTLAFFIPSPLIIFSSSIFIAYNYDMWNNLLILGHYR